jgi:sugar phosphate isomerase/epimerase
MVIRHGQAPCFKNEHQQTNYLKMESQMRAVPMGNGFPDYGTFINALKSIGYQGFISYEMCEVLEDGGSVENPDKSARIFLEYIKKSK